LSTLATGLVNVGTFRRRQISLIVAGMTASLDQIDGALTRADPGHLGRRALRAAQVPHGRRCLDVRAAILEDR